MDAYSVDIDKYIEWYKDESQFMYYLDEHEYNMTRCAIISYRLHLRYMKNDDNTKSEKLHGELLEKVKNIEGRIKEAKAIRELDLMYYPTPNDWDLIELLANGNTDIEEINRRLSFIKVESRLKVLEDIRCEFVENWESPYLDRYKEGKPLIKIGGVIPSMVITTLGVDFQHIKAVHYIDSLLKGDIVQATNTPKKTKPLQWTGKAAHLGFIFYELANLGYIEPPKKGDGEINYNEFARKLLECFDIDTKVGTMANAVNPNKNNMENKNKDRFNLPHIKEIS